MQPEDGGRLILWARYVDWSLTTPLLLLDLATLVELPFFKIIRLISVDLLMIITGESPIWCLDSAHSLCIGRDLAFSRCTCKETGHAQVTKWIAMSFPSFLAHLISDELKRKLERGQGEESCENGGFTLAV